VTTSHFGQTLIPVALCVLALLAAPASARAQAQESTGTAVVHGYVLDSTRRPVANATVVLILGSAEQAMAPPTRITHTDSEGHYRFAAIRAGQYTLRAEMVGYDGATIGPGNLRQKETVEIDLFLASTKASELLGARPHTPAAEKPAQAPEFFDEPQFTVAGVTQATSSGGHGSDTILRTTEALAKATASLSKDLAASSRAATSGATETSLRDAVARAPESFEANRRLGEFLAAHEKAAEAASFLERASQLNPSDSESHHLLGDAEEELGKPLEAVREYQRAAELDPSEPNLFDWGTELLTHRALEPAAEVFTKGTRLFPKSVRMLIALGVAWHARGSYDHAAQCLAKASDLAPDNPTPYLFLGRMQNVEATPSEGSLERLERFAQLQPDNALANYYYAVALWKQPAVSVDSNVERNADSNKERSTRVESLLQKAVRLDPKLGAAYLQLGILYSQRGDFSRAISAYQKALEVSSELDETLEVAHYRLAQAYLRNGDKAKGQQELQLHDRIAKTAKEHHEHQRREIQQFVIALRNQNPVSPPQP
jgi:tetratricopeptide (TPR) repeat protein